MKLLFNFFKMLHKLRVNRNNFGEILQRMNKHFGKFRKVSFKKFRKNLESTAAGAGKGQRTHRSKEGIFALRLRLLSTTHHTW